ncbi:MAG: hypothetical protein HC923_05580 [Myxococcales bacterium]|nr:hypothetical protein [Myxococcales bacterium]
MRPRILRASPRPGRHVLVYLRKFGPPGVMDALRKIERPTIVYGLGERPPERNLTFKAIHEQSFVDDLASSEALLTTAGNQIVGEALYLRKPVLAMPEANNFEQRINAHFLAESGAGEQVQLEECDHHHISRFRERVSEFRRVQDPNQLDGSRAAAAEIERQLERLGCPIPEPRFVEIPPESARRAS